MRGKLTLLAGVCAGAIAFPAYAQQANNTAPDTGNEIVVTAQRSNERLQDVPIAVSAFTSEALEKQQIKNTSDLQLTLPNVTFTKTNFTSSSFTIRGIGDLCVGVSCDSATAIHMNDAPLFGTRLFEGEFYDMAQIEVLRGPQGTLFGRNATSGVVNIKSARPQMGQFAASAEAEYGNYNAVKVKGMVNVPIGETIAARVAGYYLNRDGYTKNLANNSKIDGRDMYGFRGSLRFEPGTGTTIDLMAQYFRESDNRMRSQKQLCQRDPTGVLGCLNKTRDNQFTNLNSTAGAILTSTQTFAIFGMGALANMGLTDLTAPNSDGFAGVVNPADPRVVSTSFEPKYYTSEWIAQAHLNQELGETFNLSLGFNYQDVKLESQQNYNNADQNRLNGRFQTGLTFLSNVAAGAAGPAAQAYFAPIAARLIPSGPTGALCTSLPTENLAGVYGTTSHSTCTSSPLAYDRSNSYHTAWSTEAILSTKFDGPFNFLLGGIYGKVHLTENSYYVDAFSLDYSTGILGSWAALAGASSAPASFPAPTGLNDGYYMASPFYRNNTDDFKLTTYGLFGEAYYKFNDKLKLTLGIRYNHDQKTIRARTTLLSWLARFGDNPLASPYLTAGQPIFPTYDADPGCPATTAACAGITGPNQLWQDRKATFSAWTGRAVLDYNITPDNLLYFSYSRGYKSGGINPPLSVGFGVPEAFTPEYVNAFEVGSKNSFNNGQIQLNLTGFYYNYKDLQLSRIVNRTSVNDNVSAHIYGMELEGVFRPTDQLTINANASYLHTEVSQDKMLADSRDYGGGRADAVIIKDLTTAANCAVAPNTAGGTGAVGFVTAVNGSLGLAGPASFGPNSGIASTGAFSICNALLGASVTSTGAPSATALLFDPLGVTVYSSGIPVNIKGNKLPGAPDYKFSFGAQYAIPVGGDVTITPRADYIYTGKSTGNIFNGPVNEVPSFSQVNAQIQIDGADKKWFVRGWIQNVFDDASITGLYVTDQSSGLYTNIFTLEPRRYGITAGVKF
ncbi:MAG: TonB-dependent receptor [Novosphingobium sp.]